LPLRTIERDGRDAVGDVEAYGLHAGSLTRSRRRTPHAGRRRRAVRSRARHSPLAPRGAPAPEPSGTCDAQFTREGGSTMPKPRHLALTGAAILAVGGCHRAERRVHDAYNDTFGGGDSERHDRRVDLNTASHRELARLPGLTDDDADRIIANRPYGS